RTEQEHHEGALVGPLLVIVSEHLDETPFATVVLTIGGPADGQVSRASQTLSDDLKAVVIRPGRPAGCTLSRRRSMVRSESSDCRYLVKTRRHNRLFLILDWIESKLRGRFRDARPPSLSGAPPPRPAGSIP